MKLPLLRTAAALTICAGACSSAFAQYAVVAGSKSSASPLTADQVTNLYTGKSDKISGVGSLVLVDQADGAAVREGFYAKALGKTPSQVKAAWTRLVFSGKAQMPKELGSSADVKKFVAANPDAIGYIETNQVDPSVKVLFSAD